MRGLQKSKRVSWAPGVNLCQVRLFLSEEFPSQVGLGAQDHLQAKTWPLHSTGVGSDDNLPPGFEGTCPENLLKNKLSQIPIIKWRCPPRFVLDFMWHVVAGNESKEVEIQNQREMRVLEAVYPRPSSIPPNASVLMGIEDSYHNDQHTTEIPITPVEDEDAAAGTLFDNMAPNNVPMSSQSQLLAPGSLESQYCETTDLNPSGNGIPVTGMVHGVGPCVVGAYTALTALTTSSDQGNLIDRDLLLNILSNPILIEKLVTSHGAAINPDIIAKPRSPGPILSDPPLVHLNRTEDVSPLLAATPSRPFYPLPSSVGPVLNLRPLPPEVLSAPSQPVGASVSKDINYYKSLIQQHGGERHEAPQPQFGSLHSHHLVTNQVSVNNPNSRDLKAKIMKPCIYFNSSRGCRHGANCAYLHDASSPQQVGVQSAKRMKMDREITGT